MSRSSVHLSCTQTRRDHPRVGCGGRLILSLWPFALSLGLSTDKGACKAWEQQPGWLCMEHPDLWLIKRNFLLAPVFINIKQLLAAMW